MTTLLHLDASVRGDRSLSRRLSREFVQAWRVSRPETRMIRRDLAVEPPPFVDHNWIAAAFAAPDARTPEMREVLAASDHLIGELEAADVIVLGTPMFNYGLPARLKAWVDQVIRVGRTFSFDLARGDYPLEPILSGKMLVLLTSTGEFGFEPGGVRAHMNHLDTHIGAVRAYLGVSEWFHIGSNTRSSVMRATPRRSMRPLQPCPAWPPSLPTAQMTHDQSAHSHPVDSGPNRRRR